MRPLVSLATLAASDREPKPFKLPYFVFVCQRLRVFRIYVRNPRFWAGALCAGGTGLPRFEGQLGPLRGLAPGRAPRAAFHWLPRLQAFPAWLSGMRRRYSISPTSGGYLTKSPPTCGSYGR